MRTLSPDEKKVITTLELMLSLQDACEKVCGDMEDYPVNTYYLPKSRKGLWQAFREALNNWTQELFCDAVAEVGSKNFIETVAICKDLSEIKCDANTEAQLTIAKLLGFDLRESLFGFTWRFNTKAIIDSDVFGLIDAINEAIPDTLLNVDIESLAEAADACSSKAIVKCQVDLELFKSAIRTLQAARSYNQALDGYNIARFEYADGDYPSSRWLALEEPSDSEAIKMYGCLLEGCRDNYRDAMSDFGIEKMAIVETDDTKLMQSTACVIAKAFFKTLVKRKTLKTFVEELSKLTEKE